MPKKKTAKRKALDEEALRRRLAFSEIDPNVPSWADHIPHCHGKSDRRYSSNTDQNLLRSTHEQNLLLTSHGHRTKAMNLEERGIAKKTGEEVQAIIDQVVSDGPDNIPSHIVAVRSGNKSGYKGVYEYNLDAEMFIFYFQYDLQTYRPKNPGEMNLTWTVEDMARAYVYCKELIFSDRSGIGSGALAFIQTKCYIVWSLDKKNNRKLNEGETAVYPLWTWGRYVEKNRSCEVTGMEVTINSHCRTSLSIDRMCGDFAPNEDWAHSTSNCRIVCKFVNGSVTWTPTTISAFFVDYEVVSKELDKLKSYPLYNYEEEFSQKCEALAKCMNFRNKHSFQQHFVEVIPHISKEQVMQLVRKANYICAYGNITVVPKHTNQAFVFSVEREYPMLPYVLDNILIVSWIFNTWDNTRQYQFEEGKKYSLHDPFLKSHPGQGWNRQIVDDTRERYASGRMVSQGTTDAAVLAASNWMP